jgi:choline dehydrogenase-like flavoprotein
MSRSIKVDTNNLFVEKKACFNGNAAFKGNIVANKLTVLSFCDASAVEGTYDVIVIGAGSAGSCVAKRISDDYNVSVLLLEQGTNNNENPLVKEPFSTTNGVLNLFQAGFDPLASDLIPSSDPRGGPVSPMDQFTWTMSAGRGWGGAGAHNYLEALRSSPGFHTFLATHAGIYGNLWDATAANTVYQDMETYNGPPASVNRGYSGPHPITPGPPINAFGVQLENAFKVVSNSPLDNALTIGYAGDANDKNSNRDLAVYTNDDNYLNLDFTRAHGGSVFLNTTIVNEDGFGVGGRKLRVISHALVNKVTFDTTGVKPVANGVELVLNGKMVKFVAKKKVIISAGGMRSSGILERSGIGSGTILSAAGITQIYENPNVGEGLTIPPGNVSIISSDPSVWVPGMGIKALLNLGFSSPYHPAWTRRFQTLMAGGTFPPFQPINKYLKAIGATTDGFANWFAVGFNNEPTSESNIHVQDNLPGSTPRFNLNALTTDEDIEVQREYYKFLKRVETWMTTNYPASGFAILHPTPAHYAGYPGAPTNVFTGDIAGTTLNITSVTSGSLNIGDSVLGAGVLTNTRISEFGSGSGGMGTYIVTRSQTVASTTLNSDSLEEAAASAQIFLYHAGGGCKMGDEVSQNGVVNGQLHVYGVDNLMVADTSIFPVTPDSGHLVATLAGWIAADICLSTI